MLTDAVIVKLIRFMLVGMGGTLLDFGTTFLLKERIKFNKYLANSIGFLTAGTSNYIFNRIWAFKNDSPQVLEQYLVFISISLVGLGILNLSVWFLHDKWNWNFYVSKVLALFVVLAWTFSAHYLITFSLI
jgi:putative flippase GtrA